MVLEKVMYCFNNNNGISPIDDDGACPADLLESEEDLAMPFSQIFNRVLKKFADRALRTILVTFKDMSMEEFEHLKSNNNEFLTPDDRECLEDGLTALAVYGIMDPIREDVPGSIDKC